MEMTLEERVVRVKRGEESCEELIRDYFPLFKKEANRIYVKGMDFDDKVNYLAYLFYQNIFRYDETKGFKFLTMALTDMRFRMLNENRAANSLERGGETEIVSLDLHLCPEDRERYITAIQTVGGTISDLNIKELISVTEEITSEWEDEVRRVALDYLNTGDKIVDVRRRNNAESVTYRHLRMKMKALRKELNRRGYEFYA